MAGTLCALLLFISFRATAQSPDSLLIVKLTKQPISTTKNVAIADGVSATFQIRAVKQKRVWFFIINDSSLVFVTKYQNKEMIQLSQFVTNGLILSLATQNFKVKSKVMKVDEFYIDRYFKPTKNGKKHIKMLTELESGIPKKSFISRLMFWKGK